MAATIQLSEKAREVIKQIEVIDELDTELSDMDAILSLSPHDPQVYEVRERRNSHVNDLKREGIELDFDGEITRVSWDGTPWLRYTPGKSWEEIEEIVGTLEQQKLAHVILSILYRATIAYAGQSFYMASWDIVRELEALGYTDVSMGSRIPKTVYDEALDSLVRQKLVAEVLGLGQRWHLTGALS